MCLQTDCAARAWYDQDLSLVDMSREFELHFEILSFASCIRPRKKYGNCLEFTGRGGGLQAFLEDTDCELCCCTDTSLCVGGFECSPRTHTRIVHPDTRYVWYVPRIHSRQHSCVVCPLFPIVVAPFAILAVRLHISASNKSDLLWKVY